MYPAAKRVALVAAAAVPVAIVLAHQLLVPPIVGLADNGDYFRLFEPFGIVSRLTGEDRFFAFLVRVWDLAPSSSRPSGFVSADLLFALLSLALNPVLAETGHYDVRAIGIVRALAYLAGAILVLTAVAPAGRIALVLAATALIVVFCDVGYAAYFNSGYTEASSFVFGLMVTAFVMRIVLRDVPRRADLAGFALAAVLLVWSKPQNILLALPLALLALRVATLPAGGRWRRNGVAAALIIVVAGLAWRAVPPPAHYRDTIHYIAVFNAALLRSPDPRADLAELGVSPALADLAGVYPWQAPALARAVDLQSGFYPRISTTRILLFHLLHPARTLRMLDLAATNAMHLRPRLGNFEASSGRGAYAQSTAFAWRSEFARTRGPSSLAPLAALGALVVVAAFAYRRRARVVRERALADAVLLLLLAASLQYGIVALLQGHEFGAKGMVVFAFFFDAALLAGAALALSLLLRVVSPVRSRAS
jgi:hypothetical protein